MSRNGLSIVEVMVALMLVTLALLGMAGSTALALRQVTEANARRRAAHTAASRIAQLSAEGCLLATSGSRMNNVTGLHERWTVLGAPLVATVSDTVAWTSPRGRASIALTTSFPC